MVDQLTIEQLQKAIDDCEKPMAPEIILLQADGVYLGDVCRQLLALMQREAKLREALGCISRMHRSIDSAINLITLDAAISIAQKAVDNASEYRDTDV